MAYSQICSQDGLQWALFMFCMWLQWGLVLVFWWKCKCTWKIEQTAMAATTCGLMTRWPTGKAGTGPVAWVLAGTSLNKCTIPVMCSTRGFPAVNATDSKAWSSILSDCSRSLLSASRATERPTLTLAAYICEALFVLYRSRSDRTCACYISRNSSPKQDKH